MKYILLFPMLCVALSLKFCTSNKELTEDSVPESHQEVTESTGMVKSSLHGFNAENMYFHFNGEEDAMDLIKEISPQVLRFPGGTPANTYHISGPGYGYEKEDALKLVKGTGPYKNALKSVDRDAAVQRQKSVQENYAKDFADRCLALNAEVLLVANLIGPDEDILAMIRYFHERKVRIAGVELGNEYYLKSYANIFPSVESYITRAKTAAEAVRSEFPDVALGAVAASSSELKTLGMRQKMYMESWNEGLAKEDFFDAFVSHIYSKAKSCDGLSGIGKFDCYLEHNSAFAARIPGAISNLSKTFGGRPCWITEWNVKDVFNGLGNSMMQALYYADVTLELAGSEDIAIATYHNLLTSSTGYNLIAKNKNSSKPTHIPRIVHPVAAMTAPIFDGEHHGLPLPEYGMDSNKIRIAAFKNDKETMLFIVNKQSGTLSIHGLRLMELLDGHPVSLRSMSSDSLSDDKWEVSDQELNNRADLEAFSIPGHSIHRLTFKNN